MKITGGIVAAVCLVAVITLGSSLYVIPEGQQAVITQFGEPVRNVTDAGCYVKIPFVQEINRLEKRLLPWDGDPRLMPTKDKRRIFIDVWARWRIVEPQKFYTAVRTQQQGHKRLDELVDSAARAVIAKNNLIDAVRSTDNPLRYESKELETDWAARRERVTNGRREIENEIQQTASKGLGDIYGIELVDVRIKRINYNKSVREKVYERMRSERMRIASLFSSEAEGEGNRILGLMQKELDEIEGEMEKQSAEIRGEGEARVIETTAAAFGKSPEFYEFLRQLEAYKKTLKSGTRMVLSTRNQFLNQLHGNEKSE
jgi:membrane protease subunit HflC